MAENSKIQWTHHTFNPWRGCTKVSEGCKHCYAETMSKRNLKVLGQWGPNGTRVVASESMWREPMKWDAAAKAAGERHRVFCASLADVFEGRDTMPESSWEAVEAARVRLWAMPSPDTFSIPPIRDFVGRHLSGVSVDPFARNSALATYTNDINPATSAQFHMDAAEFLSKLAADGVVADTVIFDPPYSPRQISECYESFGRKATAKDTRNAELYSRCRRAIHGIVRHGSVVLSFGWNSCGMGKGWETLELMLVAHGGAHNDTICFAQRLQQGGLFA